MGKIQRPNLIQIKYFDLKLIKLFTISFFWYTRFVCVRFFESSYLEVLTLSEDFLHYRRLPDPFSIIFSIFRQALQLSTFYLNVNQCLIPLVFGGVKRFSLALLNSSFSSSSWILNWDSFSSDIFVVSFRVDVEDCFLSDFN